MTLAASTEDVASAAEEVLNQLGFTVSGVGDFIDLNPTVHPLADGVDAAMSIINTLSGDPLAAGEGLSLYAFEPTTGCTLVPEAQLNAKGQPFSGTNPDDTVFGYAETHIHHPRLAKLC